MGAQNVSANTFTNQSENQPDEVSVSVTSSSQEETEVVTNNVTDYKKEESENVINEISVVADQSKTLETEIKTSEISKESESKGDIVDPTEKISGTKVTVQSSNTKLDAEVRQSKEEGEVLNNNTTQIQPEKFVEKSQESNESVKATQNEDVRVPKVKENISFNWDNVPNAVDVFENGSLLVEKRGAIIEWITEPTFGKEFAYASVKYPDNPKVEIIKIPVKVSSAATRRERNVTFNENDTFRMVVDHQSIVDKGTGRVTGQEKTPAYYTITATPDKKHNRVDFSVKYTVGSSYVRTHRAVLGVELGEGFQQPGAIQASVNRYI